MLLLFLLSWDLYVKGGENVFNTKGKLNEMGQLDFHLGPTGTSWKLPIDVMQIHVVQLQQHNTLSTLHYTYSEEYSKCI